MSRSGGGKNLPGRHVLLPLVGIALFGAVLPAGAATIVEKQVTIDIQSAERVIETTKLRVRLDVAGDLEDWGEHVIYLDENRSLDWVKAAVISPEGRRQNVGRKQQDVVEYSGEGIAYGSQHYHTVEFPGLQVGSQLEIHQRVIVNPYFPSSQTLLWGGDDVEQLQVTVQSAVDGLRWRLDGPGGEIEVREESAVDGGRLAAVHLSGRQLEGIDPEPLEAGGGASYPLLRWAWGDAESWSDVASWYRQLMASLPRHEAAVEALAEELTAGREAPREQLEALVTYVREKVRYVAVEVGVGGYRPSPPGETLARKWGDCKDKSLLLIDLLRARGIKAYPALVRLDDDRRIDTAFPSAAQFNHLIVAVAQDAVAVEPADPISEGFFFIDPTQTRGGARYLHSGVQDQHALVVESAGGRLVPTPRTPEHESFYLAFDVEVNTLGNAEGRAGLLMYGRTASTFLQQMETAAPERVGESALGFFESLLPSAQFQSVGWEKVEGPVPGVRISLAVEVDKLLTGGTRPSLHLTSLRAMPLPRYFDDVDTTVRHGVRQRRTVWNLTLPEGFCLPAAGERAEENALGSFRQTIRHEGERKVQVDRRGELRHKFVDLEDLDDFKALALAEHRAQRRRIRLKCDSADPTGK